MTKWILFSGSSCSNLLYEDLDQTDLYELQWVNFHHISDKTSENIITSDMLREIQYLSKHLNCYSL